MPKVKAAIFCDEVRMEANGKLLLIGTYSGQMLVPSFPAQNKLQCILLIDEAELGELELNARVSGGGGAIFGDLELSIEFEETPTPGIPTWVPLPPFAFALSEPDEIELSIALNGGEREVIAKLPVAIAEPESSPSKEEI